MYNLINRLNNTLSSKASPILTILITALLLLIIFNLVYADSPGVKVAANSTPGFLANPIKFVTTFFVGTTLIGIIAVLAGVGGGVIFTPLMMGFTPIDSLIIRGTGLMIAMAGGVVAARDFLKKGIANIWLLLYMALFYTGFAVTGAFAARFLYQTMGKTGEGMIRLGLGIIIFSIVAIYFFFKAKIEFPKLTKEDSFSKKLGLGMSYWEESRNQVVRYKLTRAWLGIPIFMITGFISGLFGIGGGPAIVPSLNLVMMTPLKVSAACSKVLIGIGDTAAVWSYIHMGGIIPLFAIPCVMGMILGTLIGTRLMVWVKTAMIRYILIVILIVSGIRLFLQGFSLLGII